MVPASVSRRSMSRSLCFGLLLALLSVTAGPAFAHSENGVAIDFVGGFTHPIFGPDPRGRDGGCRTMGSIPGHAGDLGAAGRVSAGHGSGRRARSCRHAAARWSKLE